MKGKIIIKVKDVTEAGRERRIVEVKNGLGELSEFDINWILAQAKNILKGEAK